MKTFVLVHGGWHGGSCWEGTGAQPRPEGVGDPHGVPNSKGVAPLLRAAGHEVLTPTLTGLGERAHLLTPDTDLALHVQDVVGVLEYEDLRDVVLVGHSYAGMVITGVADRTADRLAHLVYLDAFIPADGQSLFDVLRPERREMYRQQAQTHGEGWRVPPPPVEALGVAEEAQARWLAARLTPQPLRTLEQPLRLTNPAAAAIPRTYIHCTTGSIAPSFAPFATRAQTDPGWRYHELPTGHDAMLTAPTELANLLLGLD